METENSEPMTSIIDVTLHTPIRFILPFDIGEHEHAYRDNYLFVNYKGERLAFMPTMDASDMSSDAIAHCADIEVEVITTAEARDSNDTNVNSIRMAVMT
jgi:hypothetical protein